MRSLAEEFKTFILRGNVVDLAIAVVIGAAFTNIVNALVKDLVTPIIGIFGGTPDFSALSFTINHSRFAIGDFINTLISFLIVAAIIFFLVLKPINWLLSRRKSELPTDPTTRECPYCLSSIPIKATRCAFCTAEVAPEMAAVTSNAIQA